MGETIVTCAACEQRKIDAAKRWGISVSDPRTSFFYTKCRSCHRNEMTEMKARRRIERPREKAEMRKSMAQTKADNREIHREWKAAKRARPAEVKHAERVKTTKETASGIGWGIVILAVMVLIAFVATGIGLTYWGGITP
jgi:hypothetical protein